MHSLIDFFIGHRETGFLSFLPPTSYTEEMAQCVLNWSLTPTVWVLLPSPPLSSTPDALPGYTQLTHNASLHCGTMLTPGDV